MRATPIPSVIDDPSALISPLVNQLNRDAPAGSAKAIFTEGSRSFRKAPTPEMVPPEPTALTKASMRPPVCSQISGPVPL